MQETVTTTFANYIAGELPRFKVLEVKIAASQTVTAGTVLASAGISASGESFTVCNSAGEGLAKVPVCVALEDATTGESETKVIKACFQGEIDITLKAGGSDTAYTHVDALRARGIFITKKV